MKAVLLFLALPLCLAPAAAQAETPTGVWFVGGSVSESSSAYAGGVVSLPGHSLGHGPAIRLGLSGGRYEYDAGATPITAEYGGAETALVYQFSGKWGWANLSAGPKFSHTKLSPIDPGNKLRGSRWDLGLQSDGAFDGAHWRLGWFASYGVANEAYQAKLQLSRKLSAENFRLGIEAGIQGDPSYKKGIVGAFIGKAIGRNLDLQIGSGISEQRGRGPRVYGSIGLSRVF
jgi:hypothetical protein